MLSLYRWLAKLAVLTFLSTFKLLSASNNGQEYLTIEALMLLVFFSLGAGSRADRVET